MKRMVENSEKIEELADIVKIKDGDLITSNITTTGGDKIYIYSDNQVTLDASFPGSVVLTNLGTALLFEVSIESGTQNGTYPIARILGFYEGFNNVKISNGNELNASLRIGDVPNELVVNINFDESLADKTRPEYTLIFLIGHYSKEL